MIECKKIKFLSKCPSFVAISSIYTSSNGHAGLYKRINSIIEYNLAEEDQQEEDQVSKLLIFWEENNIAWLSRLSENVP